MEDTTEKNVWKMEIVSQLCFYWRVHFWDLWIRVWILELWEPSWLFSRPKGCLILLDIQPPPRRELVGGCLDSPCPNIDNLWNWAEWEYVCAWFCWSGFVSDKNAKMPGSHSISLTPSLTVKQLLAIWDMLLFVIILTSSTYRAISLDQMTYGWSMCLHRGPFCVCECHSMLIKFRMQLECFLFPTEDWCRSLSLMSVAEQFFQTVTPALEA